MDIRVKRRDSVCTRKHIGRWILLLIVLVGVGVVLYRYAEDPAKEVLEGHSSRNSSDDINNIIDILRSLPYINSVEVDEGENSGVVFYDPESSWPGYNLYSIRQLCTAELIDAKGNVINSWHYEPSKLWSNCELLPNGDLLVTGSEPSIGADNKPLKHATGKAQYVYVLRFDWYGQLLWKRRIRAHHDIEVTPDGKLLLLTSQERRIPKIHPEIKVTDNQLTLLDQDGMVIESHSVFDAILRNSSVFPLQKVKPSKRLGVPRIDLFHCNSVEWMYHKNLVGKHPIYDLGNILVCSRHQDAIAIINWKSNKVVWAWGQGEISGPHNASMLKNGHILLFDNGLGRKYSRVIELNPVTEKIVWEYKAKIPESFYTASRGSAQRLPNGNTLTAESDKGRVIEITAKGNLVWEFLCPHKERKGKKRKRQTIVRMKRYPLEYVEAIINTHDGQHFNNIHPAFSDRK